MSRRVKQVIYDNVVQSSNDDGYVLDPVVDNQIQGPVAEPMEMNDDYLVNETMHGAYGGRAYGDPAMSHPWQGGEYWFNPRYGLPPFMCRFPCWMHFARSRLWFRGEYLLWWMSGTDTPIPADAKIDSQSGGRGSLGYWFTEEQCFGMELNYLGIGEPRENLHAATGSTAMFQSFEFLLRRAMTQRYNHRVDFLFGYRYGRLDDLLAIDNPTSRYETLNKFNGAELGMSLNKRKCRLSYEMLMKLALGRTSSHVDLNGTTYKNREFSVMPEVGVNLMYSLTQRTSFTVGYSLIYLSHVARPGDQETNMTVMRTTDFWTHGLNLGLDFRF